MTDNNAVRDTIREMKRHRDKLTQQQFRTLCGQAKAGNTAAALRGLERIRERGQANGKNANPCGV